MQINACVFQEVQLLICIHVLDVDIHLSLPSLLPVLNGLLENTEMNIRIAVGQAIALLFELARELGSNEEVRIAVKRYRYSTFPVAMVTSSSVFRDEADKNWRLYSCYSLSHSLSHTHTHTHTLSLSHTHTLSLSLSLSHTHTLSLSHTHTLSLSHSPWTLLTVAHPMT